MGLSKLPDLVKAQICTFLEFEDIKKLEQTNKTIQAFLKRRGLDKPRAFRLNIFCVNEPYIDSIGCSIWFAEDTEVTGKHLVKMDEFGPSERGRNTQQVPNVIKKFHSLDRLNIFYVNCVLRENLVWETIKTKIRSVRFYRTRFSPSEETFLKFCKQFKEIIFTSTSLNAAFINDQFFVQMVENRTTVLFKSYNERPTFHRVAVTDATIDTLWKRGIPNQLYLEGLISNISFERIKQVIEDVVKVGVSEIKWNFGFMKEDQMYPVLRFVRNEFVSWTERLQVPHLAVRFRFSFPNKLKVRIFNRGQDQDNFSIMFAVVQPEDFNDYSLIEDNKRILEMQMKEKHELKEESHDK